MKWAWLLHAEEIYFEFFFLSLEMFGVPIRLKRVSKSCNGQAEANEKID